MSADAAEQSGAALTAAPQTAVRKKRTRWAIVAIVALAMIVAGIGVAYLVRPKPSAPAAGSTAAVERRDIKVVVSATGDSVVGDSVTVNPEISGTVKKLYVSLGETVTAGDDLYTISSSNVESQLLKAEASLLQAKQSKTQAIESKQKASSQVYQAKTQVIQADENLDKLESQPASMTTEDALKIARRQVTAAEADVTSAKTAYSASVTGVQAATASLASAQRSYDDARTDTKNTVVTAPIGGVVTALPISVGSAVTAGTTSSSSSGTDGTSSGGTAAVSSSGAGSSSSSGSAITISDMKSLKVQVDVSEVDIPKVSAGQQATVTFDAIPGRSFAGKVGSIAPNGTTSSGVVNYAVDVQLATLDPALRPDMSATADILTSTVSDVLVVPSSAVKTSGSSKYVVVLDAGGQTRKQTVTVGSSDDTYTEVKTGVTEGQSISTASTTTKASTGGGLMPGSPGGARPGGAGGN